MNVGVVMYQTSFTKGQELVAQRMTRELIAQGHRAVLITGPFHDNQRVVTREALRRTDEGYVVDPESECHVPLVRVDGDEVRWPPRRITFHDFVSTLNLLVQQFNLDTIISHSTLWNGPEEIVKFIKWQRMLTVKRDVVYAHMAHYQPPDPQRYAARERVYRMVWNVVVFPEVFRTADLLLCTTPLEEQQMVRMGARWDQCHLFPGGVDEAPFQRYGSQDPSSFLEAHGIPGDAKLVTYLGTVEERKNPLAVVRVAKRLSGVEGVHFVLAGRPASQDAAVRRESDGLRNLSYVGPVSEAEKVMLIGASYLNVLLSRMEALGLTQLEFMYAGVPVVTSAIGGQGWLVRDAVDGIHVDGPDDVTGAAEAVDTLLHDPDTRDRLGSHAQERAHAFSLRTLVAQLSSRLCSLRPS